MEFDRSGLDDVGGALLAVSAFRSAGEVDPDVPPEFGVYAIAVTEGARLPDPFGAFLDSRGSRLIYIGEAQGQSLRARLLGNELRARGNGTFFRSLGAVLGYRPPLGSLAGRSRQQNYRFAPADRSAIIDWINAHLLVSWVVLPEPLVHSTEVALIRAYTPLLNLRDNPAALPELAALRSTCRQLAATPSPPQA